MYTLTESDKQKVNLVSFFIGELLSSYDSRRQGFYPLIDAILLLLQAKVVLAFVQDSDDEAHPFSIVLHTARDPTLRVDFERQFHSDSFFGSRVKSANLLKLPIALQEGRHRHLYLAVYHYRFSGNGIAYELQENTTRSYSLLSAFLAKIKEPPLSQFFSDPIVVGNHVSNFTQNGGILRTLRNNLAGRIAIQEVNPPTKEMFSRIASDADRIINDMYDKIAGSYLLTHEFSMGGGPLPIPNFFFIVVRPLANKYRYSEGNGYKYTLQFVVPDSQRSRIIEKIGGIDAKVLERCFPNESGISISSIINMLCEPFVNERSVLDMSASSGFLGFYDPKIDSEYTKPQSTTSRRDNLRGDKITKERRNGAAKFLFDRIFGLTDLNMQCFTIHCGGAAHLLICSLSRVHNDPHGDLSAWLQHYYFHKTIVQKQLSTYYKKEMKKAYINVIYSIVCTVFSEHLQGDEQLINANAHLRWASYVYPFHIVQLRLADGSNTSGDIVHIHSTPYMIIISKNWHYSYHIDPSLFKYKDLIVEAVREGGRDAKK